MNWTHPHSNLRFDRRARPFPRKIIFIALALTIFTMLWFFVDHNTLFWLLLPIMAILFWIVSYGWREALTTLIFWLQRLEQI